MCSATKSERVPYSKNNDRDQDEKLLQPYSYFLRACTKNVPSKISRAFNYWLNIPEDKLVKIQEIMQLLENACLLIDDVQDDSTLRGGHPVAHKIYGVPSTINAANYVMFVGLERLLDLQHPEAVSIYTEQGLEFFRGQGMEIYWRDNFICPGEDEYRQMATNKSGSLFKMVIRLMQLYSDNKADYTKLAQTLGLYYQIHDDYINLQSKDYMLHKTYCEDLTEGKFSFPLIHAINSRPDDRQIIDILKQRTRDNEVKKHCVSLLGKFGSFEYTKRVLSQMSRDAREEARKFGKNPLMEEMFKKLFKIE